MTLFLTFLRLSIQPKIVGILWMVPIYGVISFISLVVPPYALYLDMLRDCYEVRSFKYKQLLKI